MSDTHRADRGMLAWAVKTAEQTVAEGTAEFLVVPTSAGEIGILRGHQALVAGTVAGELRITAGGGAQSAVPVGPGLVEVRADRVTVLLSAGAQRSTTQTP